MKVGLKKTDQMNHDLTHSKKVVIKKQKFFEEISRELTTFRNHENEIRVDTSFVLSPCKENFPKIVRIIFHSNSYISYCSDPIFLVEVLVVSDDFGAWPAKKMMEESGIKSYTFSRKETEIDKPMEIFYL